MNSLRGVAASSKLLLQQRGVHTTAKLWSKPVVYSPRSYNVPLRPVSMDDMMEPYGDFKVAYEAERRSANKSLVKGIVSFTCACLFFYYSGVMDELFMPNLDRIMEETEPFHQDLEGRVSVRPD